MLRSATTGGMVGLPPPPHARLSLFDSCHRKIRLIGGGPVAFLGGLVAGRLPTSMIASFDPYYVKKIMKCVFVVNIKVSPDEIVRYCAVCTECMSADAESSGTVVTGSAPHGPDTRRAPFVPRRAASDIAHYCT
ncbi:unnamed protein product [Arctia plantaginis]|uniref:Uncharacterized protein n=1 Tax=Arctia plantaginis TaxID=874455 RepID=A0A8S0YPZ4_ARCPL|nr:unnamed protein product [Arctia plantaginis]CAB3235575.1 unnamed protein product [Arctia plantaginis]